MKKIHKTKNSTVESVLAAICNKSTCIKEVLRYTTKHKANETALLR